MDLLLRIDLTRWGKSVASGELIFYGELIGRYGQSFAFYRQFACVYNELKTLYDEKRTLYGELIFRFPLLVTWACSE